MTTTQNFAPDDPFASADGDAVGSDKEDEDETGNAETVLN